MKWTILAGLTLCLTQLVSGQERAAVSGYIRDADNGEALIGANVLVANTGVGTSSNAYGFYSLSLEPGTYTLAFSYLGFSTETRELTLGGDVTINVELTIAEAQLEEVVVSSESRDRNVSSLEMSVNRLEMQTVEKMPTLLGEVEILRSIQLLPGVTSVGEGAAGFNVRGGSIDQNLVLLDEAPVYNSSHLFGFFSVFNPDAVRDVKLYKGGIPSRYGGRISSILDVRMKEGNRKHLEINGGVGLIFSRLSIETPIIKDRMSFIVAGRRSYIDVLAAPFLSEDLEDSRLNFYDLTLKTNFDINEKNRVFFSGYFGKDNFGFGDQAGFSWGNTTTSLRWNRIFSSKLFSNLTLYYSDYDYEISFGNDAVNKFDWNANIENFSAKQEMTAFFSPSNVWRFGGQIIGYIFHPGKAIGISEGDVTDFSLNDKYGLEWAVFAENELSVGPFKLNYGLRLSSFQYLGEGRAYYFGDVPAGTRRPVIDFEDFGSGETIATYTYLEPRISVNYRFGESSIKASYNRTAQYLHLISNTTATTPVDIWTPSTNNLKPQQADQVALGYFRNFQDDLYEFSLEGYYKETRSIVEYIDGADLILNQFLEGELLEGNARAYGLEMQIKKQEGKISGWISYTLSRSERKVDGINGGRWYPSRYDQTHNLSLTGFLELGGRWSLSGNFVFITGTPTTFPTSRFEQQGYVIPHNGSESRNNVRIPGYHRLDLSATLAGKEKPDKRWQGEWVFSLYNVYARRNPFSIFFRQGGNRIAPEKAVQTEAVRLSVFGTVIPSVSYNFSF